MPYLVTVPHTARRSASGSPLELHEATTTIGHATGLPDDVVIRALLRLTPAAPPAQLPAATDDHRPARVQYIAPRNTHANVYTAHVDDRDDGLYVFATAELRDAFSQAVQAAGGHVTHDTLPINDAAMTDQLIADEQNQ